MKIRAYLLSLLAVCTIPSLVSAKVCFLVGTNGQCGRETTAKTKECDNLGYNQTVDTCKNRDGVDEGMPKLIPAGGVCGGFFEKCVCNPAYYTLTGSEPDHVKYDYPAQYKCSQDNLYHRRFCKSNIKYVTPSAYNEFGSARMSAAGYNSVTSCNKVLGTTAQCTDVYGSHSITRSTQCLCDTTTYPYTTVSDATAFKLSDECDDEGVGVTDSNKKHFKNVVCSEATVNSGKWKSTCATDTEYSAEEKTETTSKVKCKLCKPETCEHKYTNPQQYGSKSSCESSGGFNSNTQKCVTSGNTVGSTQCYKVENKTCTDHSTSTTTYYKDKSNCESGMGSDKKCVSGTVQGLTCFHRETKVCTDYNSSYYTTESACNSGRPSTQTCKQVDKSEVNNLTCYKRVNNNVTCEELNYSSYKYKDLMRAGVAVDGVKDSNNKPCYTHEVCKVGDYLHNLRDSGSDQRARYCTTSKGGHAKILSVSGTNNSTVNVLWLYNVDYILSNGNIGWDNDGSSNVGGNLVVSRTEATNAVNKISKAELETYDSELHLAYASSVLLKNYADQFTYVTISATWNYDELDNIGDVFFGTTTPVGVWTTDGLCYTDAWEYTWKCTNVNDIPSTGVSGQYGISDTQMFNTSSKYSLLVSDKYLCLGAGGVTNPSGISCGYDNPSGYGIAKTDPIYDSNGVVPQLGVVFGKTSYTRKDIKNN